MKKKTEVLSETRLERLRKQGFAAENDLQLSKMAFGIRFAYRTCLAIITIAMITQSIVLFTFMLFVAFLGIVLPNHPFDYVYNFTLSKWLGKPEVPPRPVQLKFACSIATVWLASVVFLLDSGHVTSAMVMAGILAMVAALPSTIDYCVPSEIYVRLFLRNKKKSEVNAG
jgi:hypothetical protein